MITCHSEFDLSMFGDDVPLISLQANALVFIKGETSEQAYVVKKGEVHLRLSGRSLEAAGPGCMFGEVGLLYPHPRVASAVVVEDADLLVIDRALFGRLCLDFPEFSAKVMKLIARRWGGAVEGLAAGEGVAPVQVSEVVFRRATLN